MFYLLHSVAATDVFKRQLPPLIVSFFIAELFYKFGSFTLECGAFLITWYVLDAAAHWMMPRRTPQQAPASGAEGSL